MLSKDVLKESRFECQIKKSPPKTIKGYINNNMQFLNFCENEFNISDLDRIKNTHIKSYMQFLRQKQLSEIYINGILKCIRASFKYCQAEGYLIDNPSNKVGWQKEAKVLINTLNLST